MDLVIFEGSVSEHQKPKSELMFNFSFSGSYPRKTTKTSFLRSSLIPEWMDLGIITEVEYLRGGNPKRSCSSEIKK
jgi:hypothetical protein